MLTSATHSEYTVLYHVSTNRIKYILLSGDLTLSNTIFICAMCRKCTELHTKRIFTNYIYFIIFNCITFTP